MELRLLVGCAALPLALLSTRGAFAQIPPPPATSSSTTAIPPPPATTAASAATTAPPTASAPAPSARLELTTSDHHGYIYIDGKLSGDEGAFAGDVTIGPHTIEVRREGFDTFTKSISVADKQTYAETITLSRPASIATQTATPDERPLEGLYGGLGILGGHQLGSTGSELDTGCGTLGASSCSTPTPFAAGMFGYVGYTWNPVGFEVMFGGLFDWTKQHATYDGTAPNGENALVATPPRDEKFTMLRYGGMGALRVRATIQNKHVRGSFAGGIGLAYKGMYLQRDTATTDGNNLQDVFHGTATYFTPGISLEASAQFRVTPTVSLAAGLWLWAESAGSSTIVAGDSGRVLSGGVPIATPSYHVASGSQVFFGPYFGLMFGP